MLVFDSCMIIKIEKKPLLSENIFTISIQILQQFFTIVHFLIIKPNYLLIHIQQRIQRFARSARCILFHQDPIISLANFFYPRTQSTPFILMSCVHLTIRLICWLYISFRYQPGYRFLQVVSQNVGSDPAKIMLVLI